MYSIQIHYEGKSFHDGGRESILDGVVTINNTTPELQISVLILQWDLRKEAVWN